MLGVLNPPRHVKAAGVPSLGWETSMSMTVISWVALILRGFFASQAENPQPCGTSQPACQEPGDSKKWAPGVWQGPGLGNADLPESLPMCILPFYARF